ncbi:MAG TPA: hypothetical protein VMT20_12040 [Terriglobia bacterium]|nr:hypothetical protein [Terriglobia bacterium]
MDFAPSRGQLMRSQPRRSALTLVVLLAAFGPLTGSAQPLRIFFGDSTHPLVSGEAWLVANRWGANPGVLVATIRNGELEERPSVQFPPYWEQAFDYRLLLAVANRPVAPPPSLVEDDAYSAVGTPDYLQRFSTIYISPPLPAKNLGRDWPTALHQIGGLNGGDLVLAAPVRRSIRLLYPDGRPLVGAQVGVRLYGSSRNHCGVAVGITLGTFTTNADGELAVVAPTASLALSIPYYEVNAGGPAGEAFSAMQDLIVGGEPVIIVKKRWTLPEHEYVVHLRSATEQPIPHAHLTACMNFDGCGAGCGPIMAPESDASGTIRFREQDLRSMRSVTVVSEEGRERNLTDLEMHEFLSSYHLDLRWGLNRR